MGHKDINNNDEDSHPIMMKNAPYLDSGIKVIDMTPQQFKSSYKGIYHHYFKRIKDNHNKFLGVETTSKLLKIMKKMNFYGVIYKITQIKDENGNKINDGPVLVVDGKKTQNGYARIGRTIELFHRLKSYRTKSKNDAEYHFERALNKYGFTAFKIEIIAVCRSKKELVASEYFWQLYFNRENNAKGFNLDINNRFNPDLGSREDSLEEYYIPKWELITFILQGIEKQEIRKIYGNRYNVQEIGPDTLDARFIRYFSTRNFHNIQLKMIKPLLDKCLKSGYTIDETLDFIEKSGINFYTGRPKPHSILSKHAIKIFGDLRTIEYENKFDKLREIKFIQPFTEFLRRNGVNEFLPKIKGTDFMIRDENNGRLLERKNINVRDWSIVEHLFTKDVSAMEIAIQLGLCARNDPKEIRLVARGKINDYLRGRWSFLLRQSEIKFSINALRVFLKSHNLGYNNYMDYLDDNSLLI